MRVAVIDSGLGLVTYAAALGAYRPDIELVLGSDPDYMPYGLRPPEEIASRVLATAASCAPYDPDAIVVACNTGSMYALEAVRARYEPNVAVIGVVPAIRPAGASGEPFAVWATAAATAAEYQGELIEQFAKPGVAHRVPAHGLAEAIDRGDDTQIAAAIAAAAAATPESITAVVLGCTHYGLVRDEIAVALQRRTGRALTVFDSPDPVARQTLRRLELTPQPDAPAAPVIAVLASGRLTALPQSVAKYPAGRALLTRTAVLPGAVRDGTAQLRA